MSFVAFCSFLSYALIATVTPGPNNILALSSVAGRPLGFWSGLALQFVNVKVLLCGLTALTSFVLPHAPDGPHVLGCALVFAALGVACNLLWAGAGGLLRETFRRHGRALNLLLAGLLAGSVLQMLM